MLRVVVIDDSPVARDLICEILNGEPDIEVVGTARDGAEGVEMVQKHQPDVVTMDVQMPRMDGYEATREIMIARPTPIVVVSGSMSDPDVEKSMHSLQAGALTVIGKPHAPTSPEFEHSAELLLDTIRTMSAVKVIRHIRPVEPRKPTVVEKPIPESTTKLITIAASTGGPQTVYEILSGLPAEFPVPIAYVQHISDGFSEGLANWLSSSTRLTVKPASEGELPKPGTVYLAPEGRHLELSPHRSFRLSDVPPVGGFRPAASVLFESAARAYGSSLYSLILTGMGRDGVDGLKAVRQFGGRIVAQDEDSCVVYGMPRAAVEEGLPDAVLNPQQITQQLRMLCHAGETRQATAE